MVAINCEDIFDESLSFVAVSRDLHDELKDKFFMSDAKGIVKNEILSAINGAKPIDGSEVIDVNFRIPATFRGESVVLGCTAREIIPVDGKKYRVIVHSMFSPELSDEIAKAKAKRSKESKATVE